MGGKFPWFFPFCSMFLPPLFSCSVSLSVVILTHSITRIHFIWDFKAPRTKNGDQNNQNYFGIRPNICQMSVEEQMWLFSYLVNPSIIFVKWLFNQYYVKDTIYIFLQFSKLTEMTNFVTKMVMLFVHLSLAPTCGLSQLLCLRQVLTVVILWWEFLETPVLLGGHMSSSRSHELVWDREGSIWKPSSPWSHLYFL